MHKPRLCQPTWNFWGKMLNQVILYKTLCYLFTMLAFFWHRKHSNIVKSHSNFSPYKNYVTMLLCFLCYYVDTGQCLTQFNYFVANYVKLLVVIRLGIHFSTSLIVTAVQKKQCNYFLILFWLQMEENIRFNKMALFYYVFSYAPRFYIKKIT